jgi:hypothetical protein
MRKRVYAGATFVDKRFISAPLTRSGGPPCSQARTRCALAFAVSKTPAESFLEIISTIRCDGRARFFILAYENDRYGKFT